MDFFNHASKFADTISFILPRTFNRASLQNLLPLNFRLRQSLNLERNVFFGTTARCVFQVWEKSIQNRERVQLLRSHEDFSFSTSSEPCDFFMKSTGKSAGLIFFDVNQCLPKGSFLRLKAHIDVKLLVSRFEQLDFSGCYDNISVPHLTQYQLVSLYNQNFTNILTQSDDKR